MVPIGQNEKREWVLNYSGFDQARKSGGARYFSTSDKTEFFFRDLAKITPVWLDTLI